MRRYVITFSSKMATNSTNLTKGHHKTTSSSIFALHISGRIRLLAGVSAMLAFKRARTFSDIIDKSRNICPFERRHLDLPWKHFFRTAEKRGNLARLTDRVQKLFPFGFIEVCSLSDMS